MNENTIEPWLRELVRCPTCHGELADRTDQLACPTCQVAFEVREGIPVLLAADAVPLAD